MFSKSTEYAIRALVYILLRNGEMKRPGVVEIAKEIGAPESYSAKILQALTRHELIESMKGRGGGFFFRDGRQQLYLLDVILLLEGSSYFDKCGFGLKGCDQNNPCPLHDEYKVIRDRLLELIKTESIQSLAQKIVDGKAVLNRINLN